MDHCCQVPTPGASPEYRRVLWLALIVNLSMFFLEAASGLTSGSVSLQADALDFFSDATNYGLSLSVLSLAPMWRAGTALVKGISMGLFGAWVLIATTISTLQNLPPHAMTMGAVGCLALIANVGVAVMLYQFREGDANMRSVWLCTRNDAIGNAAVMVAAFGVFGTGTIWPDIAVASIMAILALKAASVTIRTAITELKQAAAPPVEAHANHGH